ncbi:MAG: DMT family transporter [Geminicoccaceae bacterium]|nr:DMT family transporter [Geminicoccaceae bacterium]
MLQNAYVLLVFTTVCWAGNAVAGQLAVGEVAPLTLVFLRWFLVAAGMGWLLRHELRRSWPVARNHLGTLAVMAVVGFTGFNALFYVASVRTSGINIGIIQGSIPMIVLAGSVIAYRTRIGAAQIVGVGLTLSGVVTVAARGSLERLLGLEFNPGDLIMLFACLLYGGYTVALKSRPGLPALVFFTWLALLAVLATLPLLAFEAATSGLVWPSARGWAVTFYVAIFPSCLAQISFIRGVELIGPERAGIFVNLVPIFAALLSVVILQQSFEQHHAAALALVLGGIAVAERHKTHDAQAKRP